MGEEQTAMMTDIKGFENAGRKCLCGAVMIPVGYDKYVCTGCHIALVFLPSGCLDSVVVTHDCFLRLKGDTIKMIATGLLDMFKKRDHVPVKNSIQKVWKETKETISKRTQDMADKSMENMRKGIVSNPIDDVLDELDEWDKSAMTEPEQRAYRVSEEHRQRQSKRKVLIMRTIRPKVIDANRVEEILGKRIRGNVMNFADMTYALMQRSWYDRYVTPEYQRILSDNGFWHYLNNCTVWKEYLDCDDFAHIYMCVSRVVFAAQVRDGRIVPLGGAKVQAPCLGHLSYRQDGGGWHRVNVAIDHREKRRPFEPQTCQWYGLSDKEWQSRRHIGI